MSFIDIHCHMAWDIDDGFENREMTEQSLQDAKADGITKIVATPHFIPGVQDAQDVSVMKERIAELKQLAKCYDIAIYEGCEVFLNDEYLDMIEAEDINTINDSRYLLCEFDIRKDIEKNRIADEQLYEVMIRSYIPIIAHAERYFHKDIDLDRIREWIDSGYVIQMNRTSLLGAHGSQIEKNARRLLKEGLVHIVATDAHRAEGKRICKMSDVYEEIKQEAGEEAAQVLCYRNPQHILQDEAVEQIPVRKTSWFQRWKRR